MKLSPIANAEVAAMYGLMVAGLSFKRACAALGRSRCGMRRHIAREWINGRPDLCRQPEPAPEASTKRRYVKWTAERQALLRSLYARGYSDTSIAYIMDVGRKDVLKYRKRLGLGPAKGVTGSKPGWHHHPKARAKISEHRRRLELALSVYLEGDRDDELL